MVRALAFCLLLTAAMKVALSRAAIHPPSGSAVRFFDQHGVLTPFVLGFQMNIQPGVIPEETVVQFGFRPISVLASLCSDYEYKADTWAMKTFPDFDPDDPTFRGKIMKQLEKATTCLRYRLSVINRVYYQELVTVRGLDRYFDPDLEGHESVEYIRSHIATLPEFRPLLFAFEATQRLMSPPGLLAWTVQQLYDSQAKTYWEEVRAGDGGSKPKYFRHYILNVTNDTPKRYTDEALSKFFTPVPAETDKKFIRIPSVRTPVKTVTLTVEEIENENRDPDWNTDIDFAIRKMRFWSSSADLDAHKSDPTRDMIIEFSFIGTPMHIE